MKSKTLIAATACVILSLTNAASISIPDISTLKGPLTNTPVPASGIGSPTDPDDTTFGNGTSSRLALYVPGNVYSDYPGWLALYNALVFQGVPVTVTKNIDVATNHTTVVAYQALQSKYMGSSDGSTWSTYVSGGNTLIAIGMTSTDSHLKSTFGVTPDTTTNTNSRKAIALNAPTASIPASSVNSQFDLTNDVDAQIPLWRQYINTGFPTTGYTVNAAGTYALGSYLTSSGANDTKQAITIKSTSNGGQAVAIGIDLGTYIGESTGGTTNGIPRSYDAEYDPGYDNILRMIKSLYSTSTSTGLVTSWPVPGNMGVHFAWTYDIDAQDSYEYAYECALDLQSRGIKGTINWQAKLVKDAYDLASFSLYYRNISRVEALGNMELSSHSVSHSPNLASFPTGTGEEIWDGTKYVEDNYFPFIGECAKNNGTWTTPIPGATPCNTPDKSDYFYTIGGSILGEARVSKFILESISIVNATVRSFRTGHLLYPDILPQVLAATGYKYSSSGASNDRNSHMPYQTFYSNSYNQAVDILEFPLSASDEDGQINGDWNAPGSGGYPNGSYAYRQYHVVQKIAKYGGQYTFLIHPTTHAVPGVTQTLFSDKLAFQQVLTPKVANVSYFDTVGGRGDFHNARIAAGIDVAVSGTIATVTVTLPKSIVDLTLCVPTAWSFMTSTVGASATPGAVILLNTVPAGTVTLTFQTSSPPVGTPTTTSTISMASPTIPAATPTPTNPRMVDDFSDPSRYSNEENALGYYTGDDDTVTQRTTVQGDWILLTFDTSSYWYTTLGASNTCNDYSQFTKINFAVRYPTSTIVGFNFVLQTTNSGTCTGLNQYPVDVTSLITAATAGSDGWLHVTIPLSQFTGIDLTSMRAITISGFKSAGQVEMDYIYFS
ncbi:hypothetical protein BGZ80_000806 [Entomortierella chlamydospora]|uniref:NodB homology domain-containing protein n=1 Tax=Entomortierella chlamydospora TaxID=101097 RepID=A0A9P6MRX1_9FUNG|nr:hypothetical protein BGZ80_000806 [Entomortierella chlamydospora]